MKVDEMPAGREMDALIAEKVMGWRYKEGPKFNYDGPCDSNMILVPPTITDDEYMRWSFPPKGVISKTFFLDGKYSTDIAAAWEVVEKIKDTNMDSYKYGANSFELSRNRPMQPSRLYACRFNSNNNGYSYAETAPLAICRAALKAVGASL